MDEQGGREPAAIRLPDGSELPELEAEAVRLVNRALFDRFPTISEDAHWMGVPVYKVPTDAYALQEIVYETRPELVVEAGVAAGGSTLMLAHLLDLIGAGEVVAVDVDLSLASERLREHPRITLIEGSSTDPAVVETLRERAAGKRVMVDLDSDHAAAHVAEELRLLAPLVTPGCYLIVEDTWFGADVLREREGPLAAIGEWLGQGQPFEVDHGREKFFVTSSRGGYLRRLGGEAPAARESSFHARRAERGEQAELPPIPPAGDPEEMQDWLRGLVWRLHEQAAEIHELRQRLGEGD